MAGGGEAAATVPTAGGAVPATVVAGSVALVPRPAAAVAVEAEAGVADAVGAGGVAAMPGATSGGDPVAAGAETGAAVGGSSETEAAVTASEATVGESSSSGEAGESTVEAVHSASTSFSFRDSEETVSEARPEVGPNEAGPSGVLEVRPVDPLLALFGEDNSWWRNVVDFIRREAEGVVRDSPNYWREAIPRDEMQASGPRRDMS